ncbi:MAG: helix-turn-helix domain-containing protein [Candidatus Goldbacteria bacterium]|nr:helix-turn-helix domain-containing protein [Candidatus Goldiibacteriota bacterium]
MCPMEYYTIMRNCKDKKVLRLKMVGHAKEYRNISLTAQVFNTTRKTVYKWLKRHELYGYAGLDDYLRRPKHSPKETSQEIKAKVIAAKKKYKSLGAEQVKILAELPLCPDTIRKIWRQAGFKPRKRQKKYVTKRNLRNIKKLWPLFKQIDIDVKYLNDIPTFFLPMKRYNLPPFQYTAREVTSGLVFWAFAYEFSISNSVSFLNYIIQFLLFLGVDLSKITVQTDNGVEFIGNVNAKEISAFTKTAMHYNMTHSTIPGGAHRFQSDVETFHNIEEIEFFDIENFYGLQDFLDKAFTYQLFFNLVRPNTYKENKTPWDIVKEKNPDLPKNVCMLPPIILDKMISKEYMDCVYHVSHNPYFIFHFYNKIDIIQSNDFILFNIK